MEILSMMPALSGAGGNNVARFNLQMPNGVRLFNLRLVRKPDGSYRVYAPSAFGSSVATFDRDAAEEIVQAALSVLGDVAHDRAA